MDRKINLGLVGCGPKGAQVMYAPIIRHLQSGSINALMDPDLKALNYLQAYCPTAELYTDYEAFIAQANVDAVIVASPVYLHCDQVMSAANAHRHVLCEKPMARTIEECDRMMQACRNDSVTLMIAFMKRFDKSFQLAKQIIASGDLGEVFQVRCEFGWHIPDSGDEGWRASRITWGGMFQDHGSHTVDLCRWWLGDVESVSAEIQIVRPEREVEDAADVTLRHTSGAVSTHHVTGSTHTPLREYYLIDGTRGSLELQYGPAWSYTAIAPFQMTMHRNGTDAKDITPYNLPNLDDEMRTHSHYLNEIEHFCECILQHTQPSTTAEDGRKAIEVINAAYISSWHNTKVKLPLTESPRLDEYFRALRPNN